MVENEVLFKFEPTGTTKSSAPVFQAAMRQAGVDVQSTTASESGVVRMVLNPSTVLSAAPAAQALFQHDVTDTIKAIKKLRRRDDIAYAEPNYIYTANMVPNDPYYNLQWHYPQINLPETWDITTGSSNVIVAVIDTGVVLSHPDLSTQVIAGYDFISDPQISNDGNGIDNNPDDPGDGNTLQDSSFHGTHVAGTVAATTNNSIGIAGVAWKSRIMPIRVLGKGGGSAYDIVQGILYSAGLANDSGTVPSKKADIINMSLGMSAASQTIENAVNAARNAGVIIVVAAGNDNKDASGYSPAGLSSVLTVSAVDYRSDKAPYSNFGSVVDVAAPGGDTGADSNGDGYADGVLSTVYDGFKFYQGTSMAAPHMAGVIALMKAVHPNLTQLDVERLLSGSHPNTNQAITTDKGTAGKDIYFGHGLINALGAVKAAQELSNTPTTTLPVLSAVPNSISFNSTSTTTTLHLSNAGNGDLIVSEVRSTESWLSVTKLAQEGDYRVTANVQSLTTGVHSAEIAVSSNGGNLSIPVLVSISTNAGSKGDIGEVYILLIDPVTYEAKAEISTSQSNNYNFSFNNIASGEYFIFAGTDFNSDFYIDDPGEAKGIFPTVAQPEIVLIDRDMSNMNITVNYQTILPSSASVTAVNDQTSEILRVRRK